MAMIKKLMILMMLAIILMRTQLVNSTGVNPESKNITVADVTTHAATIIVKNGINFGDISYSDIENPTKWIHVDSNCWDVEVSCTISNLQENSTYQICRFQKYKQFDCEYFSTSPRDITAAVIGVGLVLVAGVLLLIFSCWRHCHAAPTPAPTPAESPLPRPPPPSYDEVQDEPPSYDSLFHL